MPDADRRVVAYKATCIYFELDPQRATSAAEDYYAVLDGEIPLDQFVKVTTSGDVVYVIPCGDDLDEAFRSALENLDDGIYAETPTAVVDLDSMRIYRPNWATTTWRKSEGPMQLRDERGRLVDAVLTI